MSYTYEQKIKAVKLVTEKQYSYLRAGRAVGASKVTVMGWVQRVNQNGTAALKQREKRHYTGEFKVYVVEYMHEQYMSAYSASRNSSDYVFSCKCEKYHHRYHNYKCCRHQPFVPYSRSLDKGGKSYRNCPHLRLVCHEHRPKEGIPTVYSV